MLAFPIIMKSRYLCNLFVFREKRIEYLSIKQTSEKWGISTRSIQILCGSDRVPGVIKIGSFWAIQVDAEKLKDERIKTGRYIKEKRK